MEIPYYEDTVLLCFFAVPIVVLLTCMEHVSIRHSTTAGVRTLVAKRSEQSDSLRWTASGERLRTIYEVFVRLNQLREGDMMQLRTSVLEFPLNEFCRRYVSCSKQVSGTDIGC